MGGVINSVLDFIIANANASSVISVCIPLFAGLFIGLAQAKDQITWYPKLKKPWWTPPQFIFGQVWPLLYVVNGVASYLVWRQGGWSRQTGPLALYAAQLACNLSWPIVFFVKHRLALGQAVNVATLVLAAVTGLAFYGVDPLAGKLMAPYVAWLAFANALNYSIWQKNGTAPVSGPDGHRSSDHSTQLPPDDDLVPAKSTAPLRDPPRKGPQACATPTSPPGESLSRRVQRRQTLLVPATPRGLRLASRQGLKELLSHRAVPVHLRATSSRARVSNLTVKGVHHPTAGLKLPV